MDTNLESKCWWCGDLADSREHIFKKSILKKQYGLKDFKSIMQYNGKRKRIQGPSQDDLKFRPNLCQKCNNSRSSEFDKIYDEFLRQIESRFEQFHSEKQINWEELFGSEWSLKKRFLLKYFVKHIGCRLSHDNLEFSENLRNFLNDQEELLDLKIVLEIRINNKVLSELSKKELDIQFETLRVGRLHSFNIKSKPQAHFSWYTTGWFSMNYIYLPKIRKNLKDSMVTPFLISEPYTNFSTQGKTYEQFQDELELFDKSINDSITQKYFNRLLNIDSM